MRDKRAFGLFRDYSQVDVNSEFGREDAGTCHTCELCVACDSR